MKSTIHQHEILGLPRSFRIKSRSDYVTARACWKDLIIKARRAGETEQEKRLNGAIANLRAVCNRIEDYICPDCRGAKNLGSIRCNLCYASWRSSDKIGVDTPLKPKRYIKSSEICACGRAKKCRKRRMCESCMTARNSLRSS